MHRWPDSRYRPDAHPSISGATARQLQNFQIVLTLSRIKTLSLEPISIERRLLLIAPVLSALVKNAGAGEINSRETFVLQPNDIQFKPWQGLPPASGEMAMLYGGLNKSGPYVVLMKWNPG